MHCFFFSVLKVVNSHLVHSMVLRPPGGRCCFWWAAGSKRTESSRRAMIVWGRWSPPVGESNDSQHSSDERTYAAVIFCILLAVFVCFARASFKHFFFNSHGSTWPSLVKRQPTFLSQPCSCEMGQGIKKWVGGPGQNDGLEGREWENRLIRSPKLLEDVWEREGWKGWRLKGLERVRDECQSFYTSKDLGFLTLRVHGTPAASRPLSLILLTPWYVQHSLNSEEGAIERLDIMLSFMGFLCT